MAKNKSNDEVKRIGEELVQILDNLRGTIGDATSQEFAKEISYKQLGNLLAKKIERANLKFKFP